MKALVITIGGLKVGCLGFYGNEWIATPNLDRLAAEGVVFDQHYADRPDAAGACDAWRSGRYQFPIPGEKPSQRSGADLLAVMRGKGIPTVLVVDAARRLPESFAAGWDHVFVCKVGAQASESPWESALQAIRQAAALLDRHDHGLLWLDLAVLEPPWQLPEEYRELYFSGDADDDLEHDSQAGTDAAILEPLTDPSPGILASPLDQTLLRLQRSYAGMLSYLDAGLGFVLDELQAHERLDEWLLVLTANRGFPLGEHGIVGAYRPWLHEELVHLPLLLRLPGRTEAGRRVAALTQPVDLMPTLVAAFGLPDPQVHGHSLWPLCRAEREDVRAYACAGWQLGKRTEWSLRSLRWAFLVPVDTAQSDPPRQPQLYLKPDDRWEVNNVYQHHPELVEDLEQTLRRFVTATCQVGPLLPPGLRERETEVMAVGAISKGPEP